MSEEEVADVKLATVLTGETNPRGIPFVVFIENVENFLRADEKLTVESLIGALNELHQKLKHLEGNKMRTKVSMKAKIPEITRTLELVKFLRKNEDVTTHYSLSEMLYAKARVSADGSVYLWLGANVMVEYPYDEAVDILELSLNNAKERLRVCDEDLDHLRDQIITVEVNMARVFNYNVKRRRK
ncbi:hypothetical protein CTAYLR_000526 [Chrysophaeum taylorii]|uniref:Prefoldin subunit 3 n=1 Tax=Chrysophaeum taylorii TaxID=2483200 RepID=A0AAD7UHL4_9STRA|nr:hypothetical protein CTAYLR_000526 [Chrysophaeum taylorii]